MTNKQRLINNNTRIQECIYKANALPSTKGKPIEVTSLDDSLLTPENDDKVYKLDDKLYQVKKITSLKGLTIKFNEHIEPCPVIGEDDVFECSGIVMGTEYYSSSATTPVVTKISKKSKNYLIPSNLIDISFTFNLYADDTNYSETISYVSDPEYPEWVETSGLSIFKAPIINNFDCPALNENQAFIDWIFANAKVYKQINGLNDIKAFRFDITTDEFSRFAADYLSSIDDKFGEYNSQIITGEFTATFTVNGETITKTFTKFYQDDNTGNFVFETSNDVLVWDSATYNYNGTTIDEPVFTKFDCILSNSYFFINSIVTYTELIDMQYINGCEFVEYLVPSGTLDITENSLVNVKEYENVSVEVNNIINGEPIEIATETEMNALLVETNVGKVYRFTGVSSVYNTGDLYEVVEE